MGEDLRSRRAVIAGVGGSGLALAITACGGGTDTATSAGGATESSAPQSSAAQSSAAPQGGSALATTADIPVGGGTIFKDQKIVVTQPTSGEFKAFSAVCTHSGCAVGSVADGQIVCPCHGSKFNIADGAVTNGPADKPLPEQQIKVDGDQITLA
ncbi:Rieske (2Fe-2S) protein [Nonomuraea turcica]|uniref:Rieske (2Fe-2S) protein n=1 Tax=Nonomuraea sp. G32 TaxID=3067274 RepID=UPI00273AE1D3|nr:Rieske (2Fe-2S) protein [Nonomuraea sp. G32]MDP4507657.1 Rieske (2Fe-2S) protein [Nonomuraea sp. G32]